jgi:hypothetical protein
LTFFKVDSKIKDKRRKNKKEMVLLKKKGNLKDRR